LITASISSDFVKVNLLGLWGMANYFGFYVIVLFCQDIYLSCYEAKINPPARR